MSLRTQKPQEFRASWVIKVSVLLALVIWMTIGTAAVFSDNVRPYTFASIAFFVLFFTIFVAYYWCMVYVVDEYGVTYRGATEFIHFPWEEITNVRWSEMPLGGYYISTKTGGFMLNKFIKGHENLVQLIIARAGLLPV